MLLTAHTLGATYVTRGHKVGRACVLGKACLDSDTGYQVQGLYCACRDTSVPTWPSVCLLFHV